MSQQRGSGASELLRSFRSHAESIQQAELEKALNALKGGADAEVVVKNLSRSLTNKLIHTPTTQVRKSAEQGDELAGTWLRTLFDLSD
jgi:glutamyl-tRNA reductase